MTENERLNEALEDFEALCNGKTLCVTGEALNMVISAVKKSQAFEAIGTIDEFKALKEKENKDFELLLKAVKESYPMFKGAYVELDVFMGDVMRRFTRDRKQT